MRAIAGYEFDAAEALGEVLPEPAGLAVSGVPFASRCETTFHEFAGVLWIGYESPDWSVRRLGLERLAAILAARLQTPERLAAAAAEAVACKVRPRGLGVLCAARFSRGTAARALVLRGTFDRPARRREFLELCA